MAERDELILKNALKRHSLRRPRTRGVAVFDCDGTLIKGDIGEAMLYFQLEHFHFRISPAVVWPDHPERKELDELYESLSFSSSKTLKRDHRFARFADLVLSWYFDQLAEGRIEKACADIVRLFAGFSRFEARQIAEASVKDELQSDFTKRQIGRRTLPKGIRFIGESVALLKSLQRTGFDIWVISGSNQWGVAAVLKRLHLPSDRIIGIDLVEVNQVLSSTVKRPVPVLEGKVKSLKHLLRARPGIVVSDSKYDIPLFKYSADSKVLVHSDNGRTNEFFTAGRIKRDDSWFVIERPTLLP